MIWFTAMFVLVGFLFTVTGLSLIDPTVALVGGGFLLFVLGIVSLIISVWEAQDKRYYEHEEWHELISKEEG